MEVRILGVYGGQLPGKRLTSFLVNDSILIDAGGATSSLDLEEQNAIRHILISHTHLDHIKDIPFLADNVIGMKPHPIDVIGVGEVIDSLKSHLLNNDIWPDFTVIPSKDEPVLRWREESEEAPFAVEDIEIEFVRTNHPVPTFGMFLTQGDATLLYTADTGPTERIWERAREYPNIKAVILETSFPDRLAELSLISGHLSPCHLKDELKKFDREGVPVYLYHFKPAFEAELNEEVAALGDKRLIPLSQGEVLTID